ncbi:MAG TPA: cyanophycin synthetase, partial [Thermomicrobiales bacterium]|nr:cyanophycin synthetase [Thermomicrobiales bacterium]
KPGDVVVINADDPETARIGTRTDAMVLPFGLGPDQGTGAWLVEDRLEVSGPFGELSVPRPAQLSLAGDHGARNTLAAIAATLAYGVPNDAIMAGLAAFGGVENRLEVVATRGGVTWVNDTSATAPVAAIAGISVLSPRARTLHVIAGGADKRTDLSPFADALSNGAVQVYLLEGSATAGLQDLLDQRGVPVSGTFDSMASAVEAAAAATSPGDYVTLCPACASFGMFRNEFDRGSRFRQAVQDLDRFAAGEQTRNL